VTIEGYRFGRFSFLGKEYTSDAIIFRDTVTAWWRTEGHVVGREDIEQLVAEQPGTIVIGTGAHGLMKVPTETRRFIQSHGTELIVKETAEAVAEFNRLRTEGADVAIAMHLTC